MSFCVGGVGLRGIKTGSGAREGVGADGRRNFYGDCAQASVKCSYSRKELEIRDWGLGKVSALMRRRVFMGKVRRRGVRPVVRPTRPRCARAPSQAWRLLKKFIMKMMMASKGIIYSFYTV